MGMDISPSKIRLAQEFGVDACTRDEIEEAYGHLLEVIL